ncbi:gamma-glutamyl-gamma-aminobutyrate hydrolase family protein, partial [Tyzzerella sp. OttesenSCG-928-J15]|nr:gamma-glutamyl-gamma-aminobutyrate hydrolase family protein [Tyzzerella sp. OttesenSCG-928-J15]
QIINISKGGSLYQDLSLYEKEFILHEQKYDRSYAVHKVNVCDNTLLKSIFGEDTVSVNTMHHQAVKKLGKGLIASAYAPDGIIEALESEDKTIFAVQWHPEELVRSQPIMNKLFKHLISMAAEFSSK